MLWFNYYGSVVNGLFNVYTNTCTLYFVITRFYWCACVHNVHACMHMRACACVRVHACVRSCVRACVRAYVRVCVCVLVVEMLGCLLWGLLLVYSGASLNGPSEKQITSQQRTYLQERNGASVFQTSEKRQPLYSEQRTKNLSQINDCS